jgi:CysZ protein
MGRGVIASSVLASIGQLGDRRFLGVLGLGVGLTLAGLLGLYLGFVGLVGWLLPDALTLPWIGTITWAERAISWAALPVFLILSAVLMVPVASAVMGLFLDQVADAVEDRHYPGLPRARRIGLIEALGDGARFFGLVVVVNLLALVGYVMLAPIAPILFWGVNGYLLGREYGQMVALRRSDTAGARAFRRAHAGRLFLAGAVMAVPLSIPVVNLLVPVLGAASFTHLYHRLSARHPSRSA